MEEIMEKNRGQVARVVTSCLYASNTIYEHRSFITPCIVLRSSDRDEQREPFAEGVEPQIHLVSPRVAGCLGDFRG
jgi:hypothetical protein